jgi:DNA-directed RNA polymerase subunit RPC12/RpoP
MGIRFFCPNGHKLNVKEFQAGMRGVCPRCGSKFLIPTQSTRPSSKKKHDLFPDPDQEEAVVAEDLFPAPEPVSTASPQTQAATSPSALATAVAPDHVAADPIAAAGNVVWYVRPPSGEQYGPAPGEILRTWLAEGRISADTLLWREGWSEWREAQSLFPELRQAVSGVLSLAEFPAPDAASPTLAPLVKRKTAWNNQKNLVISLAVLVLILLIVLFYIILH